MKISLARKIILGALVLAFAVGGAVYVLAQDESTTDTETSACALRHHRDDWRRNPLDALAELDMTIAELRDHLASGGTIQELLANSDRQAEREAAHHTCIDESGSQWRSDRRASGRPTRDHRNRRPSGLA